MVPETSWDSLLAVNHVDTIVLRLVLCIAQAQFSRQYGPPPLVHLLNATIYLLRLSLDLVSEGRGRPQRWSVVCAFLWTSWQRILMLHLRSAVGPQLHGFNYNIRGLNSIRAQDLVPETFEYRSKMQQADLKATPYLCAWAYRNLIEDRACISSDVRHIAQHLHACFGDRKAVCNAGHVQCNGLSSVSCGRFENTTVVNQSMHSQRCSGKCTRLFWSRESFVAVSGPKAIDIAATSTSSLRYCQVTTKSLAISHIWSHGQGGRPDKEGLEGTGFNMCLHQRYSGVAVSLGCSSYWMDTPCIPSEKGLRRECIANIHEIFTTSKITLVCDRDLMSIDITGSSVDACEKLLATLLVCDWNMRAWTLLESMRGRSSLYLLCADDRTIKLYDVLQTVYQKGSVDILVPYLTRSYLLPPDDITDMELFEGGGSVATEEDRQLAEGFISVGEAAVLLSHRHATRDEDDVLIWDLLIGDTPSQDAAEMWRRQIGKKISTGALVSSAPRLQDVAGFHWAPSRPTLPRRSITNTATATAHEKTFLAYDGGDAKDGEITADGLRAKWLTCRFTTADVPDGLPLEKNTSTDEKLAALAKRYTSGFAHGILLQVCPVRGPGNVPLPYQGSNNHVLVVCGSHDGFAWEWRGVYEWERTCPLPPFVIEEILLV
ncbi:HET domain protein [Cladophialophora carrionii]|uniref:HET domain protein n=1 Tax=Cladophialophora carrionii TaxID=86049 RepID=A0A1C1CMI7_9EURO|nr:HET domain protein [Cladophialophora carrionii]